MELKVQVSDELFKDVAENSLRALKPEQLTEICQQAILEFFKRNNYDNVEKLIVDKGNYSWDYKASDFTHRIIESCDFSKLQEVVDKCIEELTNNYESMIKNIIADMICNGLTNNYAFQESLKHIIREEIIKGHNR